MRDLQTALRNASSEMSAKTAVDGVLRNSGYRGSAESYSSKDDAGKPVRTHVWRGTSQGHLALTSGAGYLALHPCVEVPDGEVLRNPSRKPALFIPARGGRPALVAGRGLVPLHRNPATAVLPAAAKVGDDVAGLNVWMLRVGSLVYVPEAPAHIYLTTGTPTLYTVDLAQEDWGPDVKGDGEHLYRVIALGGHLKDAPDDIADVARRYAASLPLPGRTSRRGGGGTVLEVPEVAPPAVRFERRPGARAIAGRRGVGLGPLPEGRGAYVRVTDRTPRPAPLVIAPEPEAYAPPPRDRAPRVPREGGGKPGRPPSVSAEAIRTYAQDMGDTPWSSALLASDLGVGRDAARRAVEAMAAAGELRVVERGTGTRPSLYVGASLRPGAPAPIEAPAELTTEEQRRAWYATTGAAARQRGHDRRKELEKWWDEKGKGARQRGKDLYSAEVTERALAKAREEQGVIDRFTAMGEKLADETIARTDKLIFALIDHADRGAGDQAAAILADAFRQMHEWQKADTGNYLGNAEMRLERERRRLGEAYEAAKRRPVAPPAESREDIMARKLAERKRKAVASAAPSSGGGSAEDEIAALLLSNPYGRGYSRNPGYYRRNPSLSEREWAMLSGALADEHDDRIVQAVIEKLRGALTKIPDDAFPDNEALVDKILDVMDKIVGIVKSAPKGPMTVEKSDADHLAIIERVAREILRDKYGVDWAA